jgi:hypothetical protein
MKIVGIEGMSNMELQMELQRGGKFVTFQYCISILVMTFKRQSNIYFIKADENAVVKGLPFTLLSLFLGWWGIPWGIIYTIETLGINFKGGRDVTQQIIAAVAKPKP